MPLIDWYCIISILSKINLGRLPTYVEKFKLSVMVNLQVESNGSLYDMDIIMLLEYWATNASELSTAFQSVN